MLSVAIVGTRTPHESQYQLAKYLAHYFVTHGFIVHTGGAVGIDQAVMEGCLEAGYPERCIVFLPWANYNEEIVRGKGYQIEVLNPDKVPEHKEWLDSVAKYHPNPYVLRKGGLLLHARNYGIVKGTYKLFACPGGNTSGGTAQSIRVARALGIPVVNFAKPEWYNKLKRVLDPYMKKLGVEPITSSPKTESETKTESTSEE